MSIADVDGDGQNEIVVGGAFLQAVKLTSTGGLQNVSSLIPTATPGAAFRFADVDDDSRMDLLVADNPFLEVYRRRPDGSFMQGDFYYIGTSYSPITLQIGDVNHDGLMDVVMAIRRNGQSEQGAIAIFYQQVGGTFASPVLLPLDAVVDIKAVAVGDLNGDGLDDIAVADIGTQPHVTVLYQRTDGTLATPTFVQTASNPYAVQIVDIDQDGRRDLVVGEPLVGGVSIYRQKSDGSLLAPPEWFAANDVGVNFSSDYLSVADVNADGLPDIVLVGQGLTVLYNRGISNGIGPMTNTRRVAAKFLMPARLSRK